MLDSIIDKKDVEKPLYDVEKEILERDKPNVWNIWEENNMERVLEVDFQKFVLEIASHSNMEVSKITTFIFYAEVERLKEKHKKK